VKPSAGRVWCLTLGCDKNLVDSEALLGRFAARGFAPVAERERADIWVLNSCGFIGPARADSRAALAELAAAKGPDRFLVVTGCWSQEHGEAIAAEFPAVDLMAGVGQFDEVVAACADREAGPLITEPARASYPGLGDRRPLTPPHLAFVKISEGCSCSCTFCRIPQIRGPLRSRAPAEIVAEVRGLGERGVQEIVIVSQNTSDFGRDSGDDLLDLITQLNEIEGIRWIRLLYFYAGLIRGDTIERLLDLPKVVPYLDLPIQHASPPLLRAMKRPGDPRTVERFLLDLRANNPELVLRTTCLLGFPGEEEEDVERLADFLARVEFDHLGTYRYSPEDGTPAAALAGQVPAEEAVDREALILDLQAEISARRQERRLGGSFPVLVDAVVSAGEAADLLSALQAGSWWEKGERADLAAVCQTGEPVALGRSYHLAYDLDGVIVMPAGRLAPGDWVEATFAAVTPFDTWALPV